MSDRLADRIEKQLSRVAVKVLSRDELALAFARLEEELEIARASVIERARRLARTVTG